MKYVYRERPDLRGLYKLFAGYIFIFVNIRVYGFDVMPDLIGFIIIIAGLKSLSRVNPLFSNAVRFAWGSAIISIFEIYRFPLLPDALSIWDAAYFLTALLSLVMNLLLFHRIIDVFSDLLMRVDLIELSYRCKIIWSWYRNLRIAIFLTSYTSLEFYLGIFFFILNTAVFIQFLRLLRKIYKGLNRPIPIRS